MSPYSLRRRTFLRGLLAGSSVCVGLPLLESMLNTNGEALADGTELPTRFGIWFWGNGVRPERWTPLSTGADWVPNDETQPLLAHRRYVSVVSGTEIKTATHPHHSGMAGIFTGRRYHQLGSVRDTIVSTFASQSVDQIAADHFVGQTPFRSLELGIASPGGTDEGSTFQHVSHNGPNNPNPSEYTPRELYNRLFGLSEAQERLVARQSVLDAVHDQAGRLSRRLGSADRHRLDQHMESIRRLELQLTHDLNLCDGGELPGTFPHIGGQEQISAKNLAMSKLLALALACDLTRVFTIQFSTAGSAVVFWDAGASEGLHGLCHTESMPQPTVHRATTLTMGYLADFLKTLRQTPEGKNNLLDNCSILCTSELSDGHTHSNQNFPILIAGLGGGRLKGNWHYASPNGESSTGAVLTALRGAGVPADSFGDAEGYVEDTLRDLES